MRCLLIEDYPPLRQNMAEFLTEEGYALDATGTGDEGLWYAENHSYDVIVLDLMLPGVHGLDILKKLRTLQNNTPVLVISARDSIEQRIQGLDAGADDYLVKPFALTEMSARLRAMIRRGYQKASPLLLIGDLTIDTVQKIVKRDGEEIRLTRREFALLEYLARREGQAVSRTEIWEHVYEDQEGGTSNTVDVYIGYLRRKLNCGQRTELIHTRRGFGYTLSADPL